MGKLTSRNHLTVMPRDMQVWVTNIDYYDKLGRVLQQTSFSELQDYITFAILHKYGGYVDQETAQLKNKFLKPYAESLGIDQVSYWPFLLDLASPGLQQILQSRWSSIQLSHAIKQALMYYQVNTKNKPEFLPTYFQISSMKIQLMSYNGHDSMGDFYSELKIQSKQSLLIQLVQFNNFLSQKAISTDLSKLIPDHGNFTSVVTMALFYARFINTQDQWLTWSKTPKVFQSILAIEITGRIYKDYLSINHHNQPDSNLPGIFLTHKELFYQWIFQLICPGFDYANIITHNNVLLHSIEECDIIRTALKLSPTFRWFMECS
ncbi:unnamed protein product [Schistosoma margrebowiei]|uniref:Uncharacterized protein n=1 Tax=Schistosoma margrebowiei TaxID=48269 RepID=A0A3P8CFE1_9TREM|nr:unnamed protein product [Schistosoma margrebowiei]